MPPRKAKQVLQETTALPDASASVAATKKKQKAAEKPIITSINEALPSIHVTTAKTKKRKAADNTSN